MESEKNKILLVDDVEVNLAILSEIISAMGQIPLPAENAKEAIQILKCEMPQLILLDISMPEVDGIEFCGMLKQDVFFKDIPVIFISALDNMDDFSKAFETGAVDFITKPFEPMEVQLRVSTHLKLYHMQKELEETNKRLNAVILKKTKYLRKKQTKFYDAITRLVDYKDPDITHHYGSESEICRKLTQALQFSVEYGDQITDNYVENMDMSARVHDVGKLMLPDRVVYKKDRLNLCERKLMEQHTICGSEQIEKIYCDLEDQELLNMMIDVTKYHHECYNGSGYPSGLVGEEIPLSARIMAVVDVYDAIVNARCYKEAMSHEEAIAYLQEQAGEKFDPVIVYALVKIQRQILEGKDKSRGETL